MEVQVLSEAILTQAGSICEDSPIGFDKWLPAVRMIANDKNGISSWELRRPLGVTQKTAWFMLQRIRLGDADRFEKAVGLVEVAETFIGGKARNTHKNIQAHAPAPSAPGNAGS